MDQTEMGTVPSCTDLIGQDDRKLTKESIKFGQCYNWRNVAYYGSTVYIAPLTLSGHLLTPFSAPLATMLKTIAMSFWFVEDESLFISLLVTTACLLSTSPSCLLVHVLCSEII